jgi:hypothetical protein
MPAIRSFARWACLVVLTAEPLLLTGCRQWNWRGPGFGDRQKTGWADKLRSDTPSTSTMGSGLDERAREIERNLGVQ